MMVELPYTDTRQKTFSLPSGSAARLYLPRLLEPPPPAGSLINGALDAPLGSLPLEQRLKADDRVLIVCDDLTRPTPARQLLPPLLERLHQAGLSERQVEILFALGTHRPMTSSEMQAKIGQVVFARIACHNHNAFDHEQLHHLGESVEGIPVWLNRRLTKATFVIGLGDVSPHAIVGYGGGGKILYPGVAGETTIADFHATFNLDPANYYGAYPTPARKSIEHLGRVAGLDFVINTVLDAQHRIRAVFAGDQQVAFEAGVAASRKLHGLPARQLYDVVVVSSYPHWHDFWQGVKGIFAGATLARPGGDIILVTACPEGAAQTHPDYAATIGLPSALLAPRLARRDFQDVISAAGALKVAYLREQFRVSLVSDGLTLADVEPMGFGLYHTVEAALEAVFSRLGRRGRQPEIGVLPYGGHTFCYPV